MELYRVNIDYDNYFEVESILLQNKRIINIRSIRGRIGDEEFDGKDTHLKRLLHHYIPSPDNVELINILSREYNGWNWFDAYDKSYNTNREITKNELLSPSGIVSREVDARASTSDEVAPQGATSDIVDIRRFSSEVRESDGKHLKSSALYSRLHKGLPHNLKIDIESIDYIPVWYINGATNDGRCELFCCFEILVHILAKRFVEFKAKLLQLASTDIQLAKETNQTMEKYMHMTQIQLIHKIEKLKESKHSLEEMIKEMNAKLDASAIREQQLLEDCKSRDEKIDTLMSVCRQGEGLLDEANAKIDEILLLSQGQSLDNQLIKQKMNVLSNKVLSLNASNYDDEGTVTFVWTLFRSESMRIGYTKVIPPHAIWLYSQIREDKNKELPEDAEILFEANVVSRTIYESLTNELKPMTIDTFYRHILISYEDAIGFIERLNELLDTRGIHPEIYNIDALAADIETRKARDEIERKRAEARAKQIAVRQRIINEGKYYIYIYGRWRRLYVKDEDKLSTNLIASRFFYIRTGAGGTNIERVQSCTLENSKFQNHGDKRIHYE